MQALATLLSRLPFVLDIQVLSTLSSLLASSIHLGFKLVLDQLARPRDLQLEDPLVLIRQPTSAFLPAC